MQTLKKIPDFLLGGGEMGNRIRNYDWTKTTLGAPELWDQSLKTSVSICLNSNFPIALYWNKDLILLYNDAWASIPGNKHPWALGKPAKEVWKDIWKEIEPEFTKAFEGVPGGSKDALLPMQRHGYTEECYFDFTFTPIRGGDGKVQGVFNAVIETTYRVINERQSSFLNSLSLVLASSHTQKKVFERLNDFFKQNNIPVSFALFYRENNDGLKLFLATHDNKEFKLKKPLPFKKISEQKEILLIENVEEYLQDVPKGYWEEYPVEAVILPVKDLNSNATNFILCGLNARRRYDEDYKSFFESLLNIITKNLNTIASLEEERKHVKALAEIDKAKTLFFTNISHEFRTPLTLMLGPIEEALNDLKTHPENKGRMDIAHRNAIRLLKLVNRLLDFSRIESGTQKASFALTDIVSFTKKLVSNFQALTEKAGLQLIINTHSFIQPVYVDKEMWEKIVFNLLSNAFKYTMHGSITVELLKENNYAVLKVKDTGAGIPENELSNMFKRFHRVQNVTGRTFEGTGIGLSLTKEFVQLHGGTISVESRLNVGSTFTVAIPIGKEHLPLSQIKNDEKEFTDTISDLYTNEAATLIENSFAANESGNTNYTAQEKSLPLILIVDDNRDMQQHLEKLLSSKFNTLTAGNGLDALNKIKEAKPELVISDVMMPVMDGMQLLKAIKNNKETEQIPVILLTARAGEESRIEGWETGADDYLVKPFSSKELIARASAQISLNKKRTSAEQHMHNLFMQAPSAIQILSGPHFVLELMNEAALSIMNNATGIQKNWKLQDVIGKKIEELIPETRTNGLIELLNNVYKTGEPFIAQEYPLIYNADGKTIKRYAKFAYVPLYGDTGNIMGIMVTGDDITAIVEARQKIEASEKQLVDIFKHAPVGIVIYRGVDFVIDLANEQALEMWGKKLEQVQGRAITEVFPEIITTHHIKALHDASVEKFNKGESFNVNEAEITFQRYGNLHTGWYNYIHEPIKDLEGNVTGIIATAIEVTEQVSARKKIEDVNRALEFSATVSDSIADAVISTSTLDEGYIITGWNKAAELMYGWCAEEVIGKSAREIIRINSSEEQRKLWQAILDTNGFWKGEVVQKTKDGKQIIVLASVAYVKNKEGKILGTVGVNRDISARKEAEAALRRAKEQLEVTFKNVPSGIYQFNNQGNIEYINERGAKLMGYDSVEQVMAAPGMQQFVNHLYDTFIILDEAGNKRPDEKGSVYIAITTGKSAEVVSRFVNKKDKTALWVLSNSTPVYDDAGKLSFILTTVTDVTESKNAEIALRESENRFRTLAETLPQMVWVRNANGIIEYGSKGWEQYSGIKDVSEAWRAMLHPDEWNMIMEKWKEDSAAGTPFRYEVRIKNREGEYRWHYTAGEPVKDESGKVIKWIGALTDIHVQKTFSEKLEQEVAQRTRELVKANEELESFNYVASHDLQEPLRKIQTFINLTEKHKNEDEKGKYFEKIKSSAHRMSELIQSILNYSRISQTGVDYKPTDLNKILDDVRTDFELLIQEKNAIVESCELPVIEANALQMHQLFSNLISNSLKFSTEPPRININSQIVTGNKVLTKEALNTKKQYAELTFSDNGIGFRQEYSEQIFQLFQRLHLKEEYSGTGIGLSIVKKIVEQHKGFLVTHSVLGKGTTFTIWLPVNRLMQP